MRTPEQWLAWLDAKLALQQAHAQLFSRYYAGDAELEIVKQDFHDVFKRDDIVPPRANVSAVGVDAAVERLRVRQIVAGDGDGTDAVSADARRIWDANDLDAMEPIAYREALVKGAVFLLAWRHDGDDQAAISVEDPEQMVIARRSRPPYDVIAAAKIWHDGDAKLDRAQLWLSAAASGDTTGTLSQWKSVRLRGHGIPARTDATNRPIPTPTATTSSGLLVVDHAQLLRSSRWARDTAFDVGQLPTALAGRVPVVEMAWRQRLLDDPRSYLYDVRPLADAHAKLLADMILAATFGAIPIRTATGIKFPRDNDGNILRDPSGRPISPFDIRADRGMVSENPDASFGLLTGANLAGYVAGIEELLRELRTVSRVPLHYYGTGASANVSAEAIKSAESTLTRRVETIQIPFGTPFPRAIEFARKLEGRTDNVRLLTRWQDTETPVLAASADVVSKLVAAGVPLVAEMLQPFFAQPTIAKILDTAQQQQLRGEDLLRAALPPAA